MLRLELLPAEFGDCLWIEYGDAGAPRRILIDGGLVACYKSFLEPKLRLLPSKERNAFELMVCTHIDADHIGGTIALFEQARETGFGAKEVWFNGYRHLPDEAPNTLGPVQGEKLTEMLVKPEWNWNKSFGGAAVVIPDSGPLPVVTLNGGLTLTLLSPTPQKLANLKPVWEEECRKAGLIPGLAGTGEEAKADADIGLLSGGPPDVDALADEKFALDSSQANGSSIAFMLEYKGKKLLLCGDAHPDVLATSLRRWSPGGRPSFDVFKLPHHGSKANVSADIVKTVNCTHWLFSTNGKKFKHPNPQAVARVVKYGGSPELVFNYRSEFNELWENAALRAEHGYKTLYPAKGTAGIALEFA